MSDQKPNTLSNSRPPKKGEGISPNLPHAESGSLSLTNTLNDKSTVSSIPPIPHRPNNEDAAGIPDIPSHFVEMSESHVQNVLNRIRRIERAIDVIAEEEQNKLNKHNRDGSNIPITKAWLSEWRETDPGPSGVITVFPEDL